MKCICIAMLLYIFAMNRAVAENSNLIEVPELGRSNLEMTFAPAMPPGDDLLPQSLEVEAMQSVDRVSFYASKESRGTTVFIDERYIGERQRQ